MQDGDVRISVSGFVDEEDSGRRSANGLLHFGSTCSDGSPAMCRPRDTFAPNAVANAPMPAASECPPSLPAPLLMSASPTAPNDPSSLAGDAPAADATSAIATATAAGGAESPNISLVERATTPTDSEVLPLPPAGAETQAGEGRARPDVFGAAGAVNGVRAVLLRASDNRERAQALSLSGAVGTATASIFLGQLPSFYGLAEVRLLLAALAHAQGLTMRLVDLKMHPRKTCAFAVIGAAAAPGILGLHRRVLCDHQTVWVGCRGTERALADIATAAAAADHHVPRAALVIEGCGTARPPATGAHAGQGQRGATHGHKTQHASPPGPTIAAYRSVRGPADAPAPAHGLLPQFMSSPPVPHFPPSAGFGFFAGPGGLLPHPHDHHRHQHFPAAPHPPAMPLWPAHEPFASPPFAPSVPPGPPQPHCSHCRTPYRTAVQMAPRAPCEVCAVALPPGALGWSCPFCTRTVCLSCMRAATAAC